MNYYALIIGAVIAIYFVVRFRKSGLEKKSWVYPVLLATFPTYYWVFAVYGHDYSALLKELAVSIGFFAVAYLSYKLNNAIGVLLLSIGYIAHAIYDVMHHSLFSNAGMPLWWPEFCGAVDVLMGLYLIYLSTTMKRRKRVV